VTEPTNDFDDFAGGSSGADEQFEVKAHQDHLLIVKLWDEISPVVTEHCPTGYVTRQGKEYPNNALRASIVDLDLQADDGSPGRVYPAAMILSGLLIKELKRSVGRTLLLVWKQKDPSDKSSPYTVYEMKNDSGAVDVGRRWLNAHPEFKAIPAPPPWTSTPRDNGFRENPDAGMRRGYRDDGYRAEPPGGYGRGQDRPPPRYSGDRDYGQHDDRRYERHDGYTDTRRAERPPAYDRDPWARQGRPDDRDGSLMSRASGRNHQGGYQDDEPPF
jgi:hypothetical protein